MTELLIKIGVGSIVIGLLVALIPYDIGLPNEIYEVLTDGFFAQIIQGVSFFFPVKFVLTCILLIFLSSYTSILWKLVTKIRDMVLS